MTDRVEVAGLSVARELHDFLNQEALPGTGVTPDRFWSFVPPLPPATAWNVGSAPAPLLVSTWPAVPTDAIG